GGIASLPPTRGEVLGADLNCSEPRRRAACPSMTPARAPDFTLGVHEPAGEPFLARLQELLRPTVVQVLIDPFLAAQLSNAVLAAQAFQHDADLLFSGMMPACGSANIPDCLFSALRYALARLSHRCSSAGLR